MPQPVDVGSVLGGRYKVTAHVMASAEQDLVLEGVDQVLNRPVSILVAAPGNASQVATSAREVATGERSGTVQVLDLGVSDGTTYLVTNHAQPADLLDLVISQDAPYVEPFFTETLGSEIFGVPRSTEPETYDDEDEDEYDDEPRRPILPRMHLPRPKRHTESASPSAPAASAAVGAAVAGVAPSSGPAVPPRPASQPRGATNHTAAMPAAAAPPTAEAASPAGQRAPSSFPLNARQAGDNYSPDEDAEYYEDDKPKRSSRLLVGSVLALLVIAAVVVAVTQLGGLFRAPVAGPTVNKPSSSAASPQKTTDAPAATSVAPTGAPAPKVAGVTRLVPGNQELDAPNDSKLPQAIDGNPASFWSSYVYASNTFGGLAESMALVVELEDSASVASLRLTQLNGSGGKFAVMLSDKPALDGARQVAEGSFTAPTITVPTRADGDGTGTAKYVIINFTELPRLSNTTGPYPFGLQVAEIQVT